MQQDKSQTAKIKPENKKRQERRPPKKITETYLHNAGLYYLQRFAASKSHFKNVMMRKVKKSCLHHTDQDFDACGEMVDRLTEKFENVGLLNDHVYARGLVTSLRRRGMSRKAILAKTGMKGIDSRQAQQSLKEYDDIHEDTMGAELRAALTLARRKKIGPYDITGKKDDQKSLGKLARAGFSYETSRRVLDLDSEDISSSGLIS